MTKMAVFEEEHGRDMQIAMQYTRRDYVFTRCLLSAVVGTLIFVAAYGLTFAVFFYLHADDIRMEDLITAVVAGALLYVLFLFLRIRLTVLHARKEYDSSRDNLREYKKGIGKLLRMYASEERLKSPSEFKASLENDTAY